MDTELEKFEKIELDFNDLAAIEEFAAKVHEALTPYRVTVANDGLLAVQGAQKFVTKAKNKVSKYFKEKRDDINKLRTNILQAEKQANEPLLTLEENLKTQIKEEFERKEKEIAIAKLPIRQAYLEQKGLRIDEDIILNLNDVEFNGYVEKMIQNAEQEKQRKEDEQKRIKEATEAAEKRAEAAEKFKKEIEEKQKKEKELKKAKEAEIEAFKIENKFDETKHKLVICPDRLELWELKAFKSIS